MNNIEEKQTESEESPNRDKKGRWIGTGNPQGRPPGIKCKKILMKEAIHKANIQAIKGVIGIYEGGISLLDESGEGEKELSLVEDFFSPELTPRDRITYYTKLVEYIYPKLKSSTMDITSKVETAKDIEQRLRALAEGREIAPGFDEDTDEEEEEE